MQNEDGGWGASRGLPSNTEATALGCLALSTGHNEGSQQRATSWLVERQREDGSWSYLEAVTTPSWSTSLAALALGRTGEWNDATRRALAWIVSERGVGFPLLLRLRYRFFPEAQAVELNPSFRGWPWAPGTFGWVEPTAYAMVALAALIRLAPRTRARERIRDGERMLLDRMCAGGGWNYGNSRVLDEDLEPFPDTTALALMALQDSARSAAITASLDRLELMLRTNDSGLTLALAILCRRLYRGDSSALAARLEQRYRESAFLGETRTIALAALALAGPHVFHVPYRA